MTDLAWTATRTDTIDRFHGQTPRREDEATIIDVFEQHPQLVLRAIDETAKALSEGKIVWAWSVLRSRLERGTTAIRDATVDTSKDKNRRTTNAENWIRNAGLHYDREDHVEAELFGDEFGRGRLTDYATDTPLRTRLLALWHELRPLGEQAERDHIAYSETCKAQRALLHQREAERKQALLDAANTQQTPKPEPVTVGAPDDDIDFDQ